MQIQTLNNFDTVLVVQIPDNVGTCVGCNFCAPVLCPTQKSTQIKAKTHSTKQSPNKNYKSPNHCDWPPNHCQIFPGDASWPRAGGMFGELLASEALRRQLGGLVVDGNCRDLPLLRQMSLPIFHRGQHPNAGTAPLGTVEKIRNKKEVRCGEIVSEIL